MSINDTVLTEIKSAHEDCQAKIAAAREAIDQAVEAATYCGALVEKAQRHHRSGIKSFLAPVMSGDMVRVYRKVHHVGSKRPVVTDKLTMQHLGIWQRQPPRPKTPHVPKSLTSITASQVKILMKAVNKRGLDNMSKDERELLEAGLEPLARVYVEVSKTKK